MVEHRTLMQDQAPAIPSASFPYGEQAHYGGNSYANYSASAHQYNVSQYGADGQIIRDPYSGNADTQYGGGITGATYGQHAPYGNNNPTRQPAQQSYPQQPSQQQFNQPFPQRQPNQSPQPSFARPRQQYTPPRPESFVPSEALTTRRLSPPPAPMELPNPFTPVSPAVSAAAALVAARAAASSPGPAASLSFPTRTPSVTASADPTAFSSTPTSARSSPAPPGLVGSPYLSRKPMQVGEVRQQLMYQYTDVQRDVKGAPVANGGVINEIQQETRDTPVASTDAQIQRPTSVHSLYDEADAYGGM